MNNYPDELQNIKSGQLYKHYKGDTYKIITPAKHSETGEWLIIYERLTDFVHTGDWKIRARPLSMFLEKVTVDNVEINRFTLLDN